METQSYHPTVTLAPHHDPFYASPASYPLHSDQYLASTGGEVEFATSFLGGSSPTYPDPHEDYHRHGYGLHRGELLQLSSYQRVSEELSSTTNCSTISPELDATGGLGFSGTNNTSFSNNGTLFNPAEDLALLAVATNEDYGHGCWSSGPSSASSISSQAQGSRSTTVPNALHGVVAPVPVLPSPPEATFLPIKSKAASFVRTPDPPLPTPAAMAVLLSSGSGSGSSSGAQSVYDISSPVLMGAGIGVGVEIGRLGGRLLGASTAVVPRDNAVAVGTGPAVPASQHEGTLREKEKKHACTMCHKRFDRPSTLRKHLLVHTGEKAFVCDICGRRFGVASNLNRHVKRCALKPVNMTACSPPKSSSESDETSPRPSPTSTSPERSLAHGRPLGSSGGKRGSVSSVSSCSSSSRGRSSMSPLLPTNGSTTGKQQPQQKRRRRAPSPSRWVPMSLLNFNLVSEDMYRSVPVPLPPVRRNLPKEERDSWDENVSPTPYHPNGWKGVLPGPGLPSLQGLRGKDMSKMPFNGHGSGTGTFMVSRVVARAV